MYKVLIAILLLSACSTSRKVAKAKQTMLEHPDELAKVCALIFPVRDSVLYLPGSVERDTLYEFVDVVIPVECPKSDKDTLIMWRTKREKEIVIEQYRDTTIVYRRDSAKEYDLQRDIDALTALNKEQQTQINSLKRYRRWIIYLIIGVVIGGSIWFFVRGKSTAISSMFKILKSGNK